jgi:HEAT repeat protein
MMTRSCSSLWIGRRARHRLAAACLAGVAAIGWTAVAAPADAPKAAAPPAQVVMVKGGRLTVDLRGAELADVLHQVAEAGGFHLTTTGELGRVTAAFSARTVEDGLRRLVQDHEMMLVYRPAGVSGGPAVLTEVQVFSSTPGRGAAVAPEARDAASSAAAIGEITGLVRARDAEHGVPRLVELLAASSDSVVRGRAVWGLSMLGGPAAARALSGALRDEAPFVRGQAAQALRRTGGAEAIPALAGVLASDPDITVRRAAARALASLGTLEADAALSAVAGDPDRLISDEARRALDRQNAR